MASSKNYSPGQPSYPINSNLIEQQLKTLLDSINLIERLYLTYDHYDDSVSKVLEEHYNSITNDIGPLGRKIRRALKYVEVNKTK